MKHASIFFLLAFSATPAAAFAQGPEPPAWAIDKQHGNAIIPVHEGHYEPATAAPPGLYAAMGDSITFGNGITNNCKAFPMRPVDIEAFCPDGASYAVLTAKALRKAGIAGHFMNVGIPGATVARVKEQELAYLPAETTLVTLYIGTNDSRAVRDPKFSVAEVAAAFQTEYDNLLGLIRQKAPGARIVLINFPNQKGLAGPFHLEDDVVARYDAASRAMDAFINRHYPEYAVVSTVCNPKSYDQTLQFRGSVHPNEAGAVVLAGEVIEVTLAKHPPAPPSRCEWLDGESLAAAPK